MAGLDALVPRDTLKRVGTVLHAFVTRHRLTAALTAGFLVVVVIFYWFMPWFGIDRSISPLRWLKMSWNDKTGYDHGMVGPVLILFLLIRRLPEVAATPVRPTHWGLVGVAVGILTYLVSVRTLNWRIAVGGLPILLIGAVAWAHSARAARLVAFPLLLLYFVIPVPGLIQATNGLQLFATKAAYHVARIAGIGVTLSGNDINSIPAGKWGFNIAEGCSGVRSLMALTLIGAVYAHLTQDRLWKKLVIFACSVPLAIVGNCLRVASILFVAEYLSPEFAARTYHEGSGFLFFFVVGLAGLSVCDWLLNHAGRRRVVTRRVKPPDERRATTPSPSSPAAPPPAEPAA
jgi:exosortase